MLSVQEQRKIQPNELALQSKFKQEHSIRSGVSTNQLGSLQLRAPHDTEHFKAWSGVQEQVSGPGVSGVLFSNAAHGITTQFASVVVDAHRCCVAQRGHGFRDEPSNASGQERRSTDIVVCCPLEEFAARESYDVVEVPGSAAVQLRTHVTYSMISLGELSTDIRGRIGRAVVRNNKLKALLVLRQERVDCWREVWRPVKDRHTDTN